MGTQNELPVLMRRNQPGERTKNSVGGDQKTLKRRKAQHGTGQKEGQCTGASMKVWGSCRAWRRGAWGACFPVDFLLGFPGTCPVYTTVRASFLFNGIWVQTANYTVALPLRPQQGL